MLQLKRVFLFSLLLHFFIPKSSNAQESSNTFYLYEDSAKQLTGETALQLFKQGKFTPTATTTLNKGFTRSVFWLAYTNATYRHAVSLSIDISTLVKGMYYLEPKGEMMNERKEFVK